MYIGREKILCDELAITAENVVTVLTDALLKHENNSAQCEYLYNYYRGEQPILQRVKTIRPEICNKIVENRANEIVTFKSGYLCGEPLQYVSRGSTDDISKGVQELNDMMLLAGKSALDKALAEWMYICGVGVRMVLSNSEYAAEASKVLAKGETPVVGDDAPFEIYTLDPRSSFVIYHSGVGEKPLAGVKYVTRQDKVVEYSVYTKDALYRVVTDENGETKIAGNVVRASGSPLKPFGIPIIEYPLNNARLGAFEIVMPILDAINKTQSNRLDGVEQFIQSLLIFTNCDIDDDVAKSLREAGLIKLKSIGDIKAEVKEIAEALDQQQTQTLTDYMYETVLNITGMPNRNGGSSTSDTGSAVQLRDGWQNAEARAKIDELSFKDAERHFLKLILRIMRDTVGTPLALADVEIKFTRRVYDNLQTKSQVFNQLMQSGYVDIEDAYVISAMTSDPTDSAKRGQAWHDKAQAEAQKLAEQQKQEEPPDGNSAGGNAQSKTA